MGNLILEIVLIIISCFLVDFFAYAFIRRIDKKEREKLAKKETEYLRNLIKEIHE